MCTCRDDCTCYLRVRGIFVMPMLVWGSVRGCMAILGQHVPTSFGSGQQVQLYLYIHTLEHDCKCIYHNILGYAVRLFGANCLSFSSKFLWGILERTWSYSWRLFILQRPHSEHTNKVRTTSSIVHVARWSAVYWRSNITLNLFYHWLAQWVGVYSRKHMYCNSGYFRVKNICVLNFRVKNFHSLQWFNTHSSTCCVY